MDQTIVEEALFGEKVYVNSAKNEAKSGRGAGELCQRLPEIRLDSLGLWTRVNIIFHYSAGTRH